VLVAQAGPLQFVEGSGGTVAPGFSVVKGIKCEGVNKRDWSRSSPTMSRGFVIEGRFDSLS